LDPRAFALDRVVEKGLALRISHRDPYANGGGHLILANFPTWNIEFDLAGLQCSAQHGVRGFFRASLESLLKHPSGIGLHLLGEPFSQRNRLARSARILIEQLRVCECLGDLEANRQRNAGCLRLIGLELEWRKDKLLTAAERGHNRSEERRVGQEVKCWY